jgi:hypothetical protein
VKTTLERFDYASQSPRSRFEKLMNSQPYSEAESRRFRFESVARLSHGLPFRDDAKRQNMDRAIKLFSEYCNRASNVIYDRFLFNR